jgi:hypothetical protein
MSTINDDIYLFLNTLQDQLSSLKRKVEKSESRIEELEVHNSKLTFELNKLKRSQCNHLPSFGICKDHAPIKHRVKVESPEPKKIPFCTPEELRNIEKDSKHLYVLKSQFVPNAPQPRKNEEEENDEDYQEHEEEYEEEENEEEARLQEDRLQEDLQPHHYSPPPAENFNPPPMVNFNPPPRPAPYIAATTPRAKNQDQPIDGKCKHEEPAPLIKSRGQASGRQASGRRTTAATPSKSLLSTLTITQLKDMCRNHCLKGFSKFTKKQDLITFIEENIKEH